MADVETGASANIIAEARASVDADIKTTAGDPVQQASLGQKITQELKDAEGSAKGYLRAEELAIHNRTPMSQQQSAEGQVVLKSLVRAAEAAKKGIPVATDQGRSVLIKLADQSLNVETASAIEAMLSDYLLGTKKIVTGGTDITDPEFDEAYKSLYQWDSNAARIVADAVTQANLPGLTADQAKQKFASLEADASKKVEEAQRKMMRGGREEGPSVADYEKYDELRQQIGRAIDDALKRNAITPDEVYQIRQFLFNTPNLDRAKVAAAFSKLNLGASAEDRMKEYEEIYKKTFVGLDLEYVKQFMQQYKRFVNQAEQEFSLDRLREKYIEQGEKGSLKLSRENRQKLQQEIIKYYYYALEKIHNDKSKSYREGSQSMEYQYYFGAIRQIISKSLDDLRKYHFDNDTDVQAFLEDKSARYQASILTYAETMHDLPLYARDAANFSKWGEFLGRLFPSELAEVFDEGDGFMQMARDEISMYIRRRLVKKGNQYSPDLISGEYSKDGVRWGLKMEEDLRKNLKERVRKVIESDPNIKMEQKEEKIKELLGEDDWKLKRALTYANGIGIATLSDIETIITAEPTAGFAGRHPLGAVLSAKENWRLGRGNPNAGKIAKYLLSMPVELFPKQRGFVSRLFKKKSWVPEEFANKVDDQIKAYSDVIVRDLFDRGNSYQELLSLINVAASLFSRAGWRTAPIANELKNLNKFETGGGYEGDFEYNWDRWDAKSWKNILDRSMSQYGAGSLWWFNGSGLERQDNQMKRFLLDQFMKHEGLSFEDARDKVMKEWGDYLSGEKALQRFEFDVGGEKRSEKRKLSYLEIRQLRLYQQRGEAFYRYMRRNPGDFALLFSQVVPELVDGDVDKASLDKWKIAGDDSLTKIARMGIFVDDDHLEDFKDFMKNKQHKTELEREQTLQRRANIRKTWGDQFDVLIKYRRWLLDSKDEYAKMKGEEPTTVGLDGFIGYLSEESGTAYEVFMRRSENLKQKIDGINKNKELTDDQKRVQILPLRKQMLYITKNDFKNTKYGEFLTKIIFDKGGLFNRMTNEDYDNWISQEEKGELGFLSHFGDFDRLGDKTAFFYIGQGWTLKNADINPFTSDINHFEVYRHLGEVGEDVAKRYLGDANAVKEMLDKVSNLETLLMHAANSGNLEEIYKIHDTMFKTLDGIIGKEYAYRANTILASIVGQFFYEHSATRETLARWSLLDIPQKFLLGKKIALSKLLTENWHAMTMDENSLRSYFETLAGMEVVTRKGAWSLEHLQDMFDARTDTFIAGDVTPRLAWFILVYLAWVFMKKAIEEAEGKKK